MSNPYLNDRAMASAAKAGWAAPDPGTMAGRNTPLTDGPVSSWRPRVMTVQGTATATGVLLVLLLASATVGWMAAPTYDTGETGFPALAIGGVIVGLICAIVVHFKPMWARVLGPVYAVAEGFFLGVISKAYESYQDGVVVQAIGATVGVFAVMLFMYRTQIIKVTDRFKRIVIGATLGLMAFYLVSFVINIFGGDVSFFRSTSWLGIGFSLFAAGLAALNLALDFDFIEKGSKAGMPKAMEWFAAFGLLITLVWLYLELLRLLSKLNQR
ncbi:MAG: Bax inhibitor-1/YccA family protein [Acidimicrobiales bacterium]|nr:Bax inhibitor-1/YccA family protein [Acidimicrobiales bacterium]MCB9392033.1 Bax inhibitor-1/YccA family protein [Acidimicrobiaceae bacterium]